ncbi:MAG: NUDIX domain-containing protein [Acidobacteriota bacterium]
MTDFIGVKIALINNDQLLMIQRDDKPGLRYAGLWDFPGGGREDSETPEECVIREVNEELAIRLTPEQITYQKVHAAMHDPKLNAYFMVAEISDKDIKNIVFGNEGQGWRMLSLDEFMNSNEVVEPLKGRLKTYFDAKVQG